MNAWQTFEAHQGRLIDRWRHYFSLYDRHFGRFRGGPIRVLEIGIGHGGGLQFWKAYFGSEAQIVGLDIDGRCKEYEESRITVHIGDQADPPIMGRFDIIIDDGSHRIEDQEASFTKLWPYLNSGGVYFIEDCHHGYPDVCRVISVLYYQYPWVVVCEKPQRVIAGTPSRPLNTAEIAAYG